MRIDSSDVSFATAYRSDNVTISLDRTHARTSPVTTAAATTTRVRPAAADTFQLSRYATAAGGDREDLQDLTPAQRLGWLAIEALVGHVTKFVRFHAPSRAAVSTAATAAAGQITQHSEFHAEMEKSAFEAQGTVTTADGRSIQFSATLTMQRSFQSTTVSTESRTTADPLVLNFGGASAQVTGASVAFDLNSDGKAEQMSFVAGGSGFLVLDRNNDGKVNNGGELFGPQTNNGFAELASYDADGNGWIDEGDPVFSQLRVWTADGLSSLAEKGVGAIATASVETPFALRDAANASQGDIRSSGIFLTEDGTAGTIQQVDLAVG